MAEYATREHATSRTSEDRLAQLKELVSHEIEDINPFTGLFQIRELVKTYMGILTIRSGNAFVIFNYYEKPGDIRKHF